MDSNNKHELHEKRQQGRVITTVCNDLCKYVVRVGENITRLGQFNWLDLVVEHSKVRIISAYRCIKSTQTQNIVFQQQ